MKSRESSRIVIHAVAGLRAACVLPPPARWARTFLVLGLFLFTSTAWPQASFGSKFTYHPPRIDGKIDVGEWDKANRISIEDGYLAILNDRKRMYFLINVLQQTKDDAEDYIWLTFDVNRDRLITPDTDLNFTLDPRTRALSLQRYLGQNQFTALEPTLHSALAARFDSFVADGSTRFDGRLLTFQRHRVWETAIDLDEIKARPGGSARLGMRIVSPATGLTIEPTPNFSRDFSQLVQVDLGAAAAVVAGAYANATIAFPANCLELTQAVQTPANTIPLVAGKTTIARVYVSVSGTVNAQSVWVYLHGRRGGVELPGSPLVQHDYVPVAADRADATDTTIFTLPDSWTSGQVEFRVRVEHAYAGEIVSPALTRSFNVREVPTMWIVPINTGTAASPVLVSDAEIASQISYLRAVYPLADVDFVIKPWTVIGPCAAGDAIAKLRAYHSNVVLGWVIGFLFSGSPPFEMPLQIYGFMPAGGGESDPIWYYGPGHGYVARGYLGTSREGTMAHEINHNLDHSATGTWGRHVPNGCDATGPDPAWPYSPSDDVSEFGFDTRANPFDPEVVSVVPSTFPDFMSYCQSGDLPTKWISPYRYQNLYNQFAPSSKGLSLRHTMLLKNGIETNLLHITGTLLPDGTAQLNPILIQPGSPTEQPSAGAYAIEFRDLRGATVGRLPFDASFEPLCENEPVDKLTFEFLVLQPRGTTAIVLLFKDKELDQITISKTAPTVTVLAPNGGEVWSGVQTLSWSAADLDRDVLSFTIQYSPDNDQSWTPVAGNVTGRSYEIDTDRLPGSTQARIRVLVTDGFHTAQDDSDAAFTLADKPPRPFIRRPQAGDLLLDGEVLQFEGDAEDLETATLPDSALRWSLGTQIIGVGRKVEAQLPEGRYQVTLTATDSKGNEGTARMAFVVQAPLGRLAAVPAPGGVVRLGWRATQQAVLQSAPDASGPYQDVALPAELDGDNLVVPVQTQESRRFYRLLLVP